MTKKNSYVSKGQVPTRNKKFLNYCRKLETNWEGLFRSYKKRQQTIKSRPSNPEEKRLKEKFIKEQEIDLEASVLFNKYHICGIKWAECVQAVKTDYIKQLHKKWAPKLKEHRKSEAKANRFLEELS